ncbi:uncharacterized protein LOC134272288 [Saccostrea cucullata]|uniref:uncharacterized protein LOC134272288 n=1 Tax=Saccostrea cuccullata TaxID=36930 RepID=UPI002ECFE196
MISGSYREGFRLKKGSDMDFMLWHNDQRIIWDLSQCQYYTTHRQTLLLCDCSDSPPGYTLLQLLTLGINKYVQLACFLMKDKIYVSSSITRLFKYSEALSNTTIVNGPCVRYCFGDFIEYDYAHCFACDFWPPSASSWIDRCHSWPQPHIVNDIVKNGCHFVAIGHKVGNYEDSEWRISFSQAEHRLVYSMNHSQFLTYGLLKLLLKEVINMGLSEEDKLLSSYHIKTAVFWVIQQNTLQQWCPQNLLECFWICFKLILKWVYEGVCPNFFIPQNNMFLSKVHGEAQYSLFNKLYGMYKKGLASFLHEHSIMKNHTNNPNNHNLSTLSDDYSPDSEIDFDKQVFCRHSMPTLPILDLNHCMMDFIDKDSYMKAVGGQSLSTKMRKALAQDIQLDNKIYYISELIPEQQSALQNNKAHLYISPFVMLHMLEILCYRHVDTMRAIPALYELQTLVHYDQGLLTDLKDRDISWQILGSVNR